MPVFQPDTADAGSPPGLSEWRRLLKEGTMTKAAEPSTVWIELGLTPLGKKLLKAMALETVALRDFLNDRSEHEEIEAAWDSAMANTDEVIEDILAEAACDPQRYLCELAIALRWRAEDDGRTDVLLDECYPENCSPLLGTLLKALIVAAGVDPARCDQLTAARHPDYGSGSHLVPVS
jgi:hypothetical protein